MTCTDTDNLLTSLPLQSATYTAVLVALGLCALGLDHFEHSLGKWGASAVTVRLLRYASLAGLALDVAVLIAHAGNAAWTHLRCVIGL